jgi:hypothetical protein
MFGISASGPEMGLPGRISAGFQSGEPQNRSSGRPKAGRRAEFEAFPIRRPKSGLEGQFPARRHYFVTSGRRSVLRTKSGSPQISVGPVPPPFRKDFFSGTAGTTPVPGLIPVSRLYPRPGSSRAPGDYNYPESGYTRDPLGAAPLTSTLGRRWWRSATTRPRSRRTRSC